MESAGSTTPLWTRSPSLAALLGLATTPVVNASINAEGVQEGVQAKSPSPASTPPPHRPLPATPPVKLPRNNALEKVERGRHQRPDSSVWDENVQGVRGTRSRSTKEVGPKLPVRVPPSRAQTSPPSMSDVSNIMRTLDEDIDSSVCANPHHIQW